MNNFLLVWCPAFKKHNARDDWNAAPVLLAPNKEVAIFVQKEFMGKSD